LVVTGTRHDDRRAEDDGDLSWLRAISKWSARADQPAAIPGLVHDAFVALRNGRPRPAALAIPPAVFAAVEEVTMAPPAATDGESFAAQDVARAAQLLVAAHRPLIWAGAGVQRSGAFDALQALAEHLQAPVLTTRQGKGSLSDRHPLSMGFAELRYAPIQRYLDESDLILAIGVQRDFSTYSQQVIQIDIEPEQIADAPHIFGLVGDGKRVLTAICESVRDLVGPRAVGEARDRVHALRRDRFDPERQLQPQWDLMCALRSALPDDAILVQGMNQMGYYSRNYYPVYAPRAYLTASSHGTLGSAFPLALGAKVAQPQRAVVALCGDGGFLYNAQELATAVQYGINVVAIVFNDNAYGNVLRAQMEEFGGRVLGTRLHNPDFVALGKAFGVHSVRATGAAELATALRQALNLDAPTLIEVPVGMMDRQY